ncbi:hypothetical protein HPB50_006393 [Hyalomma asiaticum]|uniref:Uncharacterized protein n=1 Tax=Hyalomma asiaticum TaxID=266040 RepID=A0ACB7TDF5_HYAAI|nr:hypothetical protein HPB50_006393 [Hyalomma asiaticum]
MDKAVSGATCSASALLFSCGHRRFSSKESGSQKSSQGKKVQRRCNLTKMLHFVFGRYSIISRHYVAAQSDNYDTLPYPCRRKRIIEARGRTTTGAKAGGPAGGEGEGVDRMKGKLVKTYTNKMFSLALAWGRPSEWVNVWGAIKVVPEYSGESTLVKAPHENQSCAVASWKDGSQAAVLVAFATLIHAEDEPVTEKKPAAEPKSTTEEKKEEVDSRIGFGTGFGHVAGGNGYGFNRGVSGFNQGSGGFDSANAFNNVHGFRNRDGYRTNHGFDQTTYNRYGAGYGGFNNGFNRGAGGFHNQYGAQGGFLG